MKSENVFTANQVKDILNKVYQQFVENRTVSSFELFKISKFNKKVVEKLDELQVNNA